MAVTITITIANETVTPNVAPADVEKVVKILIENNITFTVTPA